MTHASGTRVLSPEHPAASVQRFQLVMLRGPEPGATFELGQGATTLGKGDGNDVVIADATVSRCHLVIEQGPDGYLVRDLDSTNGTFVDELRVREGWLRPGGRIRAGQVVLRFVPVAEAAPLDGERESFGPLLSRSPRTRSLFELLARVAPTDSTVLLHGETGTGKSAAALAIHEASERRRGPFVVIDCGAISANLIESELFGHERGAFTGATQTRRGALESCRGGTLFIDEIDDLPKELQPKLLRALEERVIHRLGSHTPIPLDVRVVAASKKELREEVAAGRFREDLYFRLSVLVVWLPPLRERKEDLPLLVERFLEESGAWGRLDPAARGRLEHHTWPGNVRELRNVLERASTTGDFGFAELATFPAAADEGVRLPLDVRRPFKEAKEALIARFERAYLRQLFTACEGNMARAAREAGIDRKHLYTLARKHGLEPGELPVDESVR